MIALNGYIKWQNIVLLVDVQKWKIFTIKHKEYCVYLINVSRRFANAEANKEVIVSSDL